MNSTTENWVRVFRDRDCGLASISVPQIGRIFAKSEWVYRSFLEPALAFIESGTGGFETAGVSAKVTAPCVFYLRAGQRYRYGPSPDSSWSERYVVFTGKRVEEWEHAGWLGEKGMVYPVRDPTILIRRHEQLRSLAESVWPGAHDEAKLLTENLIWQLHAGRFRGPTESDSFDERVAAWRSAPGDAWDWEAEAARCDMSYSHFRQRFRQRFGSSPHQVLLGFKMDDAARRLLETPLSIKAIGADLGFSSLEGFYRAFHKRFKMPPGRFRRDHSR